MEKLGEYRFFEYLEGFRLPKEAGHVDEQLLEELLHLIRMPLQIAHVLSGVPDVMDPYSPLDAADKGVLFVEREVVPRL